MQTEALHQAFPMLKQPQAVRVHDFSGLLLAAWRQAQFLYQRQRQRRRLLELDDRLLDDIGLSRRQAREEGGKPFWRD